VGTFSEEAALSYNPKATLVPFPTITATARSVIAREVEEAIVPIENSLQGSVTDTLDVLIHDEGLLIRHELNLPIVHNLMGNPSTPLSRVLRVYSHPQALGQCGAFLARELPQAELAAALSTAGSVEQAMLDPTPSLAIAPKRAAEIYGAQIIQHGIQDDDNNVTRFVVLSTSDAERTGNDKTSVAFAFDEDRPGQLFKVMELFATAGINLTKIESRPTRTGLGRYHFLADLEGHRNDSTVAKVLSSTQSLVSEFKMFGSYPRFG